MRGRKFMRLVASNLIHECGLTPSDLVGKDPLFAGAPRIRQLVWGSVWCWVKQADPRTLGDIMACGRATPSVEGGTGLFQVHLGNLPEKTASGKAFLRHFALNAIIAEMTDILWEWNAAQARDDDDEACDDADLEGTSAESASTAGTFNDPAKDMPSDEEVDAYLAEEAEKRAERAGDEADLEGTQDWDPLWNPSSN